MASDDEKSPPRPQGASAAASQPHGPALLRLDQQLCFPLYAASRLVVQAYAPYLSALGLTYPQYLVMLVLWEENGASVKEIGARLYLDSGTLTPILKKLEKQGFVERRRSQVDDRAVLNFVTPTGASLQPRALQMVERLACESGLAIDDVVEIREMVHGLIRRFCHMGDRREQTLVDCPSSFEELGRRLDGATETRGGSHAVKNH